jgi:hypothetical protein
MIIQNNDLSILIIYILIFFTNIGPYIEKLITEDNINNFVNFIQKIFNISVIILKWSSYGTKFFASKMIYSGNFLLKKLIAAVIFISRNKQKIKDLGIIIREKEIFNFQKFLFFRGLMDRIDQELLDIEMEILRSKEKNFEKIINEAVEEPITVNLNLKETTNSDKLDLINTRENQPNVMNTSQRSKTRYSKDVYFILNDWYKTNGNSKFTKEIKQKLAIQTNLSIDQISNWMKNKKRSIQYCNNYSIYNKEYFNEKCN